MTLHVLMLEPFGGGSHSAFCHGWQRLSRHRITLLELPPTHWKWRARHSSLTLADMSREILADGSLFDVVFCTSMLNLAEWRGLVGPPLNALPAIVYFHENQFTYPLKPGQMRDYHYGYSHVVSALAATEIWFNSDFHRGEFSEAALQWLRRMPDYRHTARFSSALEGACVMPPGISPPACYGAVPSARANGPSIGWVSRWEHDKRPDQFVAAVEALMAREASFELILLGQQFSRVPDDLQRLRSVAGPRIRHCGYVETAAAYWDWLASMDFVVSTADHEFFGVAIVEALRAGALPVLPHRLAYPEVLDIGQFPERGKYLYDGTSAGLVDHLATRLASHTASVGDVTLRASMARFEWRSLAGKYDDRLVEVVSGNSHAPHIGRK